MVPSLLLRIPLSLLLRLESLLLLPVHLEHLLHPLFESLQGFIGWFGARSRLVWWPIPFGGDGLLGKDRCFVVVRTADVSWTGRAIVGAVDDKAGVSLHDWYAEVGFQVSVYNPDEMLHLG